jgi:endonuclease YncB( thermonuclease family)
MFLRNLGTCGVALAALLFAGWPQITSPQPLHRVHHVIDGDTIVLQTGQHVRYLGINTPEYHEPLWEEAKRGNARILGKKKVALEMERAMKDGYGRILAYVYAGSLMVNAELLRRGLGHLFVIEPIRYYARFRRIQHEARMARRGIWEDEGFPGPLKVTRLVADAPGDDRDNRNGEYLRICNISSEPISLEGFSISDAAGRRYIFPPAVLRPGYTLLLFSGNGNNIVAATDQLRFFWNSLISIWNNRGDVAYLRDPDGHIIDTFTHRPRFGR